MDSCKNCALYFKVFCRVRPSIMMKFEVGQDENDFVEEGDEV
jgi:hypothetical protein